MSRVFVGVGSNIDPERNVRRSLELLCLDMPVRRVSNFYCTRPLARPGQGDFYNGVFEMDSWFGPRELKSFVLRRIEAELGRRRTADPHAARTIDLDILLYGDLVIEEEGLVVPDPGIAERAFIAVPLLELAPDAVLPGSGRPLKKIVSAFAGHGMELLEGFTRSLREDLAVYRSRHD
jgi:2-amino-4-hydroxy-6-hydroxymethyldihydropteridine diphosphokinase